MARLRTDLLAKRLLAMLLETSKGLIYETLVSGQPLSLYRCLGAVYSGHPGDLSRARAHGARRTAPVASVAPYLDRPSRQALRATTCGRDRTPHCRWHTGTL